MTVTINGSNGLTFNDNSTQTTAATGFGFKNRIINGAMVIDQRNAGAVYTSPASNTYQLDRWVCNVGGGGFNVQQNAGSVTPPVGFKNYYGVTSTGTSAASNYSVRQFIEGFNTADLMFGTADAQAITLSFWVRSSLTGTFGGAIQNSAGTRSYVYSYTISSANTWEYKTVTIPGDTGGTWIGATNGAGLVLFISYSVAAGQTGSAGSWTGNDYRAPTGQINVVGTNGATFYITGVQLEKGSTATSFDYRPYTTELMLCQRYYFKHKATDGNAILGTGFVITTNTGLFARYFPVTMRTAPSAIEQSGTAADYRIRYPDTNTNCNGVPTFSTASDNEATFTATVASGTTNGTGAFLRSVNSSAYLAWSAEL